MSPASGQSLVAISVSASVSVFAIQHSVQALRSQKFKNRKHRCGCERCAPPHVGSSTRGLRRGLWHRATHKYSGIFANAGCGITTVTRPSLKTGYTWNRWNPRPRDVKDIGAYCELPILACFCTTVKGPPKGRPIQRARGAASDKVTCRLYAIWDASHVAVGLPWATLMVQAHNFYVHTGYVFLFGFNP